MLCASRGCDARMSRSTTCREKRTSPRNPARIPVTHNLVTATLVRSSACAFYRYTSSRKRHQRVSCSPICRFSVVWPNLWETILAATGIMGGGEGWSIPVNNSNCENDLIWRNHGGFHDLRKFFSNTGMNRYTTRIYTDVSVWPMEVV
jgi:hypothetical protein